MTLTLGAHLPLAQVDHHLARVLDLGLFPEIAIKGPELDALDQPLLKRTAQTLAAAGLRPTVHAPFFDLNPGALDPLIRQATSLRLGQALSVAGQLHARLMVVHPGVDKWRYPGLEQDWLALAGEFFPPLIARAQACDCRLALENIYEETPVALVRLVEGLDSEWFGHCFDTGHWHLFGRQPMAEWLEALGTKLFHLHLHDNHGQADEHLPLGEGTIDFRPLQRKLERMDSLPSITLEAHSPEHLSRSHRRFEDFFRSTKSVP
jgi:sugar phosphate isomerase/epimerase